MGGSFDILSHRFGRISSAFTERRIIKEVGYLRTVPGVGLVMMFIEFDLEVYLHL